MTLIIKQLIIRGEVVEDKGASSRGDAIDLDKVRQLIEAAKRDIEQECKERISELIENSSAR